MISKKNGGLNDSDKIFVAVALWISSIVLFVTSLTLPMLPENVAIFYYPADGVIGPVNSKYNNLLLIIVALIPASIVLFTAFLKKRHRLQNNFMSIILFSIMLSLCFCSTIAYGIMKQFDASKAIREVNIHGLIVLTGAFFLSMFCAVVPTLLHAGRNADKQKPLALERACANADKYWNVGSYGYLLAAVACTFISNSKCYIPLALAVFAHVLFLLLKKTKNSAE